MFDDFTNLILFLILRIVLWIILSTVKSLHGLPLRGLILITRSSPLTSWLQAYSLFFHSEPPQPPLQYLDPSLKSYSVAMFLKTNQKVISEYSLIRS